MTAASVLEQPVPHRLTVADFELLAESGAFQHNSRTELIEGEIFAMNALGRFHSLTHSRLFFRLCTALIALDCGLEPLIAPSVRMPPDSEPEPDIVVTSQARGKGPVPLVSVNLLIEVSDSTLSFDLVRKARVYAHHGVPEYWVIDVNSETLIQHWEPQGDAYAQRVTHKLGTMLTAATLPGLSILTDGLL